MKTAAVAELKASLSKYLARVKGGEEILITERGKPVAKIVPLRRNASAFPEHLLDLERAGAIRLGAGRLPEGFWKLPRPNDPQGRVLKALVAEREEGR
jgi:prevent-host-death family protein